MCSDSVRVLSSVALLPFFLPMRSSFLAKYSLILSTSFFLRVSNLRSLSTQPVGKGRIKIKVQDQRKFTSIQCRTLKGDANLRKISKVTYRFLDITEAPNSRMFPTTSEMSKIVFQETFSPPSSSPLLNHPILGNSRPSAISRLENINQPALTFQKVPITS